LKPTAPTVAATQKMSPNTITITRANNFYKVTMDSTTVEMHLNGGHYLMTKTPIEHECILINVAIIDNVAVIIPQDFFDNPYDDDWMLDDDYPITSVTMNGQNYPFRFNF
jgi:hypothetical protein